MGQRSNILLRLVLAHLVYLQALNYPTYCNITHEQRCAFVDCSNRSLTHVPPNLPPCTCQLNLHDNFITKMLNNNLSMYQNLTVLNISSNGLSEIESDSFFGILKLRVLDLSNNLLTFTNTSEFVFSPLRKLTWMDVSNNNYSSYPQSVLSHLKSLESLSMDGFMMSLGEGFRNLQSLSHLSLSGKKGKCNIDHISNNTFEDVPNITSLDLSFCEIYKAETEALSYLHNIETLNISGNIHLGFEGIKNATMGLQNSRLKKLVINKIVGEHTICVMVLKEHIQHLQNSSLEWIEANDNRIEIFSEYVFSVLPKSLRYANVRSSRFTYGAFIWHLHTLTGLISLDLSGIPVARDLPFEDPVDSFDCKEGTRRRDKECLSHPMISEKYDYQFIDTNLKYQNPLNYDYDQRYNHVFQITKGAFRIPPNLVNFRYSNGLLAFELSKIHIAKNNLRHLDLSFNIFINWKGPIFGLENITHLDLSENIATNVYPDFFANFLSLKVLNISHNFIGVSLYNNPHGEFFCNQQNLEVLDMSRNSITYLHFDLFKDMKSLRLLNLSRNLIYHLNLSLEHNKNLALFNCAENDVRTIESYGRIQMSKLAEKHIFSLDLSHNPLRCTCETSEFFEWFLDSSIRPLNLERTYCINDNSQKLELDNPDFLNHMKASCRSYITLSMGSMAASVFIISLMVSAISYRYRWRLTYWYYIAKLKLKKMIQDQHPDHFDFDMYVAYADSDLDFVCRDMINRMETERGALLYIRDRDSLPGAPIAENIIDGIRRSRKTVLLLSKTFLKKKWCRYELHMANMERVSTGRDVMVIVMLEDIPDMDIPPEILYEVQNCRFIDYPQDDNELDHFWANMHTSIQT